MNIKRLLTTFWAVCLLATAPMQLLHASERFDIDMQDAPLKDSLLSLGYRANTNIIANGDLDGSVSLTLTDKTIDDILQLLSVTHGFSYQKENGTILISPAKNMSNVVSYEVKYVDLDYLKSQLALFIPSEKIFTNPDSGTITVDTSTSQQLKTADYIANIDKPVQQISVKAAFLEISRGKSSDVGFDFDLSSYVNGQHGIKYTILSSQEETLSKGKVIACPQIVVANGREGNVLMGDEVPVFTSTSSSGTSNDVTNSVEFKDVGVNLKVTPRINDLQKGLITLSLEPEVSTITKWIESGNNSAPQVSTRKLKTQVRLKSGETLVIAGLLKEEEIKNITKLPILGDLPLLGSLFRRSAKEKKNTEICIAITPEIIKDENGIPTIKFKPADTELEQELQRFKGRTAELEAKNAKLQKTLTQKETELNKLHAKSGSSEKDKSVLRAQIKAKEQEIKEIKTRLHELEPLVNNYLKQEYSNSLRGA